MSYTQGPIGQSFEAMGTAEEARIAIVYQRLVFRRQTSIIDALLYHMAQAGGYADLHRRL